MIGKHDENSQSIGLGVSSTDNETPIALQVDPITGALMMNATAEVITPVALDKSRIDQNDVNTVYGVSDTDGTTLVPLRTDSSGNLLITF